jgi:hypothetical protein
MSVYDLINPMNLRRAIKSTFTGDASELVAEMFQFYFFGLYVHDASPTFQAGIRSTY